MKVELIKYIIGDKTTYKYRQFHYCCQKLERNPMIRLTNSIETPELFCSGCDNRDTYPDDECKKCKCLDKIDYSNSFPNFKLCKQELLQNWDSLQKVNYNSTIHYCPYCGEKIEVEVVKEVDITFKYERLLDKLRKLEHQKQNTWKNKKTNREYTNSQIKRLRDILNGYNYISCELRDLEEIK